MKKRIGKKAVWYVFVLGIVLSGTLLSFRYWETERRVTVEFLDTPMTEVLAFFHAEGGFRYLYCDEEMKNVPLFTGKFKDVSVSRALKFCLRKTQYRYCEKRNLVLIKPLY